MKCPSCNAIIPDQTDICPACFSQVQIAPEPLAPPPPAAPVANPREVENRSEASSRSHEGNRQAPPSKNVTTGNSRGRFSRQVPKKGLFLALAGVLAVIIIAIAGYMVLGNRQATVPTPPVAKEQASTPAPEKPAEQAPETQVPAPEAPEKKPEEKPAQAPSPPVQKKTVKKVPKASPAPAPAPSSKWTYRPDPVPAKPAPKPQAQKSGIAGWLDKTLGPEVPVTAPPAAGDARGTGM